MKTHKNLI